MEVVPIVRVPMPVPVPVPVAMPVVIAHAKVVGVFRGREVVYQPVLVRGQHVIVCEIGVGVLQLGVLQLPQVLVQHKPRRGRGSRRHAPLCGRRGLWGRRRRPSRT